MPFVSQRTPKKWMKIKNARAGRAEIIVLLIKYADF